MRKTVAVVVLRNDGKKHSVSINKDGEMCIISVGRSVGQLRLQRAVRPFHGDVVFARGIDHGKIPSFTSDAYREELLFRSFISLALSLPGLGLTVGVNDIFGRYSTRLLPLVRHAAEVRIRTHAELDDFCESCILTTGTCPFVSKYPSVIDHCELLFDPYGAGVEAGTVFGKGGCSVDPDALKLPERYRAITKMGVDAIDLAALLSLESEAFAPENCMPIDPALPISYKFVP